MAKLIRVVLAEAGQPTRVLCCKNPEDKNEQRIFDVAIAAALRGGNFQSVVVDEVEEFGHPVSTVSDAARQIHALDHRDRRPEMQEYLAKKGYTRG